MKKWNRVVAGGIATMTLVACLTGCGNGTGGSFKGSVDDLKAMLPEIELENKKVTFFTHLTEDSLTNKDNQYGMDYGLDIFRSVYDGELVIDPIVNWGEYMNKVSAMYVADQMPDVIQGGYGVFGQWLSQDLIQPVDKYMVGGFDNTLWAGVADVMKDYQFKGKNYILPYSAGPHALLYFNPKLFEQNGVDSPLDLWEEDKWTWTEFRRIAKEMTVDTDNNGATDVYGVQLDMNVLEQIIPTTGTQLMTLDENSKPVWHWDDTRVADAANLWRDMAMTDKSTGGKFEDGSAAMFFYSAYNDATMTNGWKAPFQKIFADGVVDFVPLPRYDDVDEHILSTRDHPGILAKKAKNPYGAAAFMASMRLASSTEYYKANEGWKQRYYDWGWTDEQINRAFFEFPELKTVGTTYAAFACTWLVGFSDLVKKGKTWAQVRSENESKYVNTSNELYNLMKDR